MISVQEAQKLILSHVKPSNCETKFILDAHEHVLCDDIIADRDYPPFYRATMDGYALSSSDINNKKITEFHVVGELFAGASYNDKVPSGSCIKIMTGAPLPTGIDAVIKVEDSTQSGKTVQFNINEIKSGYNVAQKGEDARKGDVVISKGLICDPAVINFLSTIGLKDVKVYSPPTVAIISTGDEIIPIDQTPLPHQIRESNSYTLKAFLQYYKIKPQFYAIVPDKKDKMKEAIEKGLQADILILTGGVSMGDADFVPDVLLSCGVRKVFHKVNIKPGKPLWFGVNTNGSVVFGLPGNPMACQVGFKVFIEPYIRKYMQVKEIQPHRLSLAKDHKKKHSREEYFPCKINDTDRSLMPLKFKGSGDVTAAIGSNGLAVYPADLLHLEKGTVLDFYFWSV